MGAVLVEVTRGSLVETRHRGAVAVVDAAGRLLLAAGDPEAVAFWRSSAKPFQAAALVTSGAADRFGLEDEHLAVACASHGGEPAHRRAVLDLLARAGVGPEALRCGVHAPYDSEEAARLARAGEAPDAVHNNCSGKHAGMLAVCRHRGWDPEGYLEPDHPLQRLILAHVAAATGLDPGAIALAVDGCGVPTFGLPVWRMALAFARLAEPAAPWPTPPGAVPAGELAPALARIRRAMTAHPYLVAGRARLCTLVMQAFGGDLVAKSGAAGVYCVGLAPRLAARSPLLSVAAGGVGVAVKVEDGAGGPRDALVVDLLLRLGLADLLPDAERAELERRRAPQVRNWAGRTVGEVRVVAELQRPAWRAGA